MACGHLWKFYIQILMKKLGNISKVPICHMVLLSDFTQYSPRSNKKFHPFCKIHLFVLLVHNECHAKAAENRYWLILVWKGMIFRIEYVSSSKQQFVYHPILQKEWM